MAEPIPISKAKGAKCPVCKKPATHRYRPFCSKRCMDLDLAKWLNEDYRIPVQDEYDEASSSGDDSGLEE